MNIEQTSGYLKKMYDKQTYFDQYGDSVFLFILLTVVVFIVHSYYNVLIRIQPIKEDWLNQRCKPDVIPFAGLINRPENKTITEFTQENFNYCLQNILVPVTSISVEPINYIVNSFQYINDDLVGAINNIRGLFDTVRNDFLSISSDIFGRLINFLIPIQQIIVKMRDTFAKITGVAVSAMYTSLGTYLTLKSLLGSVVSISIKLLIVLVGLIILSFAFLPWLLPMTLSLMSIYVAAAIPLAIIVVFLTQVMGVQVNMGIPSMPSMPAPSCFDKNTLIFLQNGDDKCKPICEVKIGDVLMDGGVVTGIMKLDARDIEMYDLHGVIVSSTHSVKNGDTWMKVGECPYAKPVKNYSEPYIYCVNTNTKILPIFAKKSITCLFFMDWDEVIPIFEMDKHEKRLLTSDVHTYFDGGFSSDVPIVLADKTTVNICDVKVGDILEHGEKVYGVVEIDGQNIFELYRYEKENSASVVGTNIQFCEGNLEEIKAVALDPESEKRLFHLLTNEKTFHVGEIKVGDYNSAIDRFLEQ
jgi:hypothetical protein